MVLLANGPHMLEVKVCNLSLYRHEKSTQLAMKRNNAIMGDNAVRHKLPLVEPHPFTKTSWRREKSLPDFYDRPIGTETIPAVKVDENDFTVLTSRLMRTLVDERTSLKTRNHRDKLASKTNGSHPKVDFTFGPITQWRTQDLIPSFVSRFERSRPLKRFYERQDLPDTARSFSANLNRDRTKKPSYKISVDGDHLNQRILKRHLLYLSPLDSYGHPDGPKSLSASVNEHKGMNAEGVVEQSLRLKNSSMPKRRTEFVLSNARIKEDTCHSSGVKLTAGSSHKFNSKIGAARSALDILGQSGAPTSLELSLKEELSSSMQRLRRDRASVQSFLVNTSSHYMPTDRNATPGERLLRQAREANKPKKKIRKPTFYFDDSVHVTSHDRLEDAVNGGHFTRQEQSGTFLNIEEGQEIGSQFDEAERENLAQQCHSNDDQGTTIAKEHTASEQTVSEQTVSEQTVSEQTVNEQTVNDQTVNEQKTNNEWLDEIDDINSRASSNSRSSMRETEEKVNEKYHRETEEKVNEKYHRETEEKVNEKYHRETEEKVNEKYHRETSLNVTLGRSSSARETRSGPIASEQRAFANRYVPETDVKDINTRSKDNGEAVLDKDSRRSAYEEGGVDEDEEIGTLNEDFESDAHNKRPKTTTEYLQRIMIKMEPSVVTSQT